MKNIIQKIRLLIKLDERIHALLNYSSFKKLLNLFILRVQMILRSTYLYAYPIRLGIEPTNICNLKCPECQTGMGQKGRAKGYRSLDRFKKTIDDIGQYVYLVDIYGWGEPFLHKDVFAMIEYAENHKVCTCIHSNFNIKFDEQQAEKLIESGLSYLTLSLDGSDQQIYAQYRKKGNLNLALQNAKILIDTKKKLNKKKPFIFWQFLIFPHNRHQLQQAKQLADKLGFDGFRAHQGIIVDSIFEYTQSDEGDIPKRKDIRTPICDWLWTNSTLHWDQGVGACCLQFHKKDDFGSIDTENFKDIWNNPKYRYARSLFARRRRKTALDQSVLCSRCFRITSTAQ